MRSIFCMIAFTLMTACSQKNTGQSPESPAQTTQPENRPPTTTAKPCPEGVKTGCNVPAKTDAQLQKSAQERKSCITKCIKSRQAEAISHVLIESQCKTACNRQHPQNQVRVIPTIEDLKPNSTTEQNK